MTYVPTYISGYSTGLVQNRENFILATDAYPVLENAFVFRERIKRKQGCRLLGRLRRVYDNASLGNSGADPWTFNIYSTISPPITETNAEIEPGSVVITIDPSFLTGNIIAPGYTNASDCQVYTTTTAGLVTGMQLSISGVVVQDGSGDDLINTSGPYKIEVIDGTSFKLGIDSHQDLGWGIWESGGTWQVIDAGQQLFDQGNGELIDPSSAAIGYINYITGDVTIENGSVGLPTDISFNYFPSLPVMGLRDRELDSINNIMLIAFDQRYAYRYQNGWREWIPGTTWTGNDSNFFWSTNYWVSPAPANQKIFWVTNYSGRNGDPIRYTNGIDWVDFAPAINAANDKLTQCLSMLPYRGRLVAFNTLEGQSLATSTNYYQRIRWSEIGNPISDVSSIFPMGTVVPEAWRDDIRGKGGFLDIPTSQAIVGVGFVRDNVVIYCEQSTWQLRYTGRTIAPFQIERVNSELGSLSTFSAVQFDTSLVGIGDKGIVECDSYQSQRIDIKIPDFAFNINNDGNNYTRVQGIRDFFQRCAYWTYCQDPTPSTPRYPTRRLVYNYENDSWAIYTDSYTTLGNYQYNESLQWKQCNFAWETANFPWLNRPALFPVKVGGNQQGFVEQLDQQVLNDPSLSIKDISADGVTSTLITSPNHNMILGQIIKITGIPDTSGYSSLNNQIFGVVPDREGDPVNRFRIKKYNPVTDSFDIPQIDEPSDYIGGGKISIRDNFRIVSKKFNALNEGESIIFGYMDILMDATESEFGEITMLVYQDYSDSKPTNIYPDNNVQSTNNADLFFNSVIPTYNTVGPKGSKYWQRIYCNTRAAFITLEFTFSNGQMNDQRCEEDVQIDAQILYMRKGGRQLARV